MELNKHLEMKNTIDFIKLDDGGLGAINFNNMIPVMESNYTLIDLNLPTKNREDRLYQKLLKEQLAWLNSNYIQIRKKSTNLYNLYKNNKLPSNVKNRCCHFSLLEEKCKEYNQKLLSV